MQVFIVQTLVIIFLAFVIFYLLMYNKSLKIERRISRFSIDSIRDDSVSFFDILNHHLHS